MQNTLFRSNFFGSSWYRSCRNSKFRPCSRLLSGLTPQCSWYNVPRCPPLLALREGQDVGACRLPSPWVLMQQPTRTFAKKGKGKKKSVGKPKAVEDGDLPEGADLNAVAKNMERYIKALEKELKMVRPGRADPGMFDHLEVDAYGQKAPLSSVADVTVKGPQTCVVNIYDPGMVSAVDDAIRECGMALNPIKNEDSTLNVPIPKTSKDQREKLVKLAKQQSEKTKQNIRGVRRSAIDETKKAGLPEDDSKRLVKEIDSVADSMLQKVTSIIELKQKDILSV